MEGFKKNLIYYVNQWQGHMIIQLEFVLGLKRNSSFMTPLHLHLKLSTNNQALLLQNIYVRLLQIYKILWAAQNLLFSCISIAGCESINIGKF